MLHLLFASLRVFLMPGQMNRTRPGFTMSLPEKLSEREIIIMCFYLRH